jgi:hypothetical protein
MVYPFPSDRNGIEEQRYVMLCAVRVSAMGALCLLQRVSVIKKVEILGEGSVSYRVS